MVALQAKAHAQVVNMSLLSVRPPGEFTRRFLRDDKWEKSCTYQQLTWNQPRKLSPKKFSKIDFATARRELRKKKLSLMGQDLHDLIGDIT